MEMNYDPKKTVKKWSITLTRVLTQTKEITVEAPCETEALLRLHDLSNEYNKPGFWVGNKNFDDWWVEDQDLDAYPVENGPMTIDDILYEPEEEEGKE